MNYIVGKVLSSSYLFLIPILLFNMIFAPKLTKVGYLADPPSIGWIGVLELVLRIVIFLIPLFLFFNINAPNFVIYLSLYLVGSILYFSSWLLIIYFPELALTRSWFVQLGPAYLPLVWLTGLALMCRSYFYIPIAVLFVVVHTSATYLKMRT